MNNKIYENIKLFIRENYLFLLFNLVLIATLTYPMPYYIYAGGGILDVKDKIVIENKKESSGSYNLCYVKEMHATTLTYLYSYLHKDWERVKQEELTLSSNETNQDIVVRDKVYLKQSNQSAVISAFKLANKEYEITYSSPTVIYILENADNNLKIGDSIISVEGINVNSVTDISDITSKYNVGDKLEVKVKNKDKEYTRYANLIEENGRKLLGISIENIIDYKTNPDIKFSFKDSETGPSGGLILSLAIYDYLLDEDITKGYKISGTGTIDLDGNVGEIGGVKYKLAGAVSSKSDIFFVPNGENYNEAIRIKKKKKYKIDVVGVDTLSDAVNYLNKLKIKKK